MTEASDAASSFNDPFLTEAWLHDRATIGTLEQQSMASEILRLRVQVASNHPSAVFDAMELLDTAGIPNAGTGLVPRVAEVVRQRNEARVSVFDLQKRNTGLRKLRALSDATVQRTKAVLDAAEMTAVVLPGAGIPTVGGCIEDRVRRLVDQRDALLKANQGLAVEAKANPDVVAREGCFALLRAARIEDGGTVSAGIEKLVRERDAAREWAIEATRQASDLRSERDEARQDRAKLYQALGVLSTLAPSLEVDLNDPVGMAKRIEAVVRSRMAPARGPSGEQGTWSRSAMERSAAKDGQSLDAIYEALLAVCNSHGKRPAETFVAFVERLAQERNHARTRAAMRQVRDEPLAGTGKGTQMPGGVLPSPDVPIIESAQEVQTHYSDPARGGLVPDAPAGCSIFDWRPFDDSEARRAGGKSKDAEIADLNATLDAAVAAARRAFPDPKVLVIGSNLPALIDDLRGTIAKLRQRRDEWRRRAEAAAAQTNDVVGMAAELARLDDPARIGRMDTEPRYGTKSFPTLADRLADIVWRMCEDMGYQRTVADAQRLPLALHGFRTTHLVDGYDAKHWRDKHRQALSLAGDLSKECGKLFKDFIEARKACGSIAVVAKLIEDAARVIAPKAPAKAKPCEVPPTCGMAQKAADGPRVIPDEDGGL